MRWFCFASGPGQSKQNNFSEVRRAFVLGKDAKLKKSNWNITQQVVLLHLTHLKFCMWN